MDGPIQESGSCEYLRMIGTKKGYRFSSCLKYSKYGVDEAGKLSMPHKIKPQQMPLQRKDEGKGRLARLTTFGKYYVTYRIINILTHLHGASKVGEKLHLSYFLQIHNSVQQSPKT